MSDEVVISLKGIVKNYGEGSGIVNALQGVDLELKRGEFVTLAGPSGSGKSTLLNIIGGLDKPTSGSIQIEGNDILKMSQSQLSRVRMGRIGFIFQSYNLIPVMTAFENAEYVLLLKGVKPSKRREMVRELFAQVGLSGLEDRFPRELSGGQQQRVAIVRAIASRPALVLADEPTANVDSKTGGALLDLMSQLNEEHGLTFFFSTHDPNVVARAKRRIVLRDGQIAEDIS